MREKRNCCVVEAECTNQVEGARQLKERAEDILTLFQGKVERSPSFWHIYTRYMFYVLYTTKTMDGPLHFPATSFHSLSQNNSPFILFFSSYNFVRKGERKKSTPQKKSGSLCEQFVLLLMMQPFWYNVTHQLVKNFIFLFKKRGRKERKITFLEKGII